MEIVKLTVAAHYAPLDAKWVEIASNDHWNMAASNIAGRIGLYVGHVRLHVVADMINNEPR